MIIKQKISEMLKDLGIPASLLGYQYLRYAVEISIKYPEYLYNITKKLYPEVARHYSTTPSRVERAMRNAITIGWKRGNVNTQERLFGYTISVESGCPTNSEFVATIVDYYNITFEGGSNAS